MGQVQGSVMKCKSPEIGADVSMSHLFCTARDKSFSAAGNPLLLPPLETYRKFCYTLEGTITGDAW